jgi:two-component system, cell cycle response regulator
VSVRNRLTLVLAVVLLPLLLGAGLVVAVVVPAQLRTEAAERLDVAAGAVSAMQAQSCVAAGDAARVMALAVVAGEPADAALRSGLERLHGYGWIVRGDTVLARSAATPDGVPATLTAAARCSTGSPAAAPDPAAAARAAPPLADSVAVATPEGTVTAVAGVLVDRTSLAAWDAARSPGGHSDVAAACPDGTAVSTASGARDRALTAAARSAVAGRAGVVPDSVVRTGPAGRGHPCTVLAAGPAASSAASSWLTWAVLGISLVLGGVLVAWLSRQLTLPVLAVTGAAERAAHGDLAVRLPVGRRDEVGRLAESFNHMAEQLDGRMSDLQHSRDLLAENIRRLGDALQRTHDLDGLLATVAAISASTTESSRATVWLLEGQSLMARVAWPVESARGGPRRVSRLDTLPGLVSGDGVPRRIEGGDAAARLGGPALASPLQRGSSVLGAVVVERSPGSPAYTDADSELLLSITGPAGVAMDNALLHRQAQRTALTDPLTGVGNLRMLTTTLAREVERARHFGRSAALLVIDIDHFREINEHHGHTAGDAILAAVAARIVGSVREVDRVARYGGEEFAVVAPELDPEQAYAMALSVWSAVRDEPFEADGAMVEVRVSVGVASWPRQATTSAELLRAADAAVAQAKARGRDHVRAAPDMSG